MMLRYYKMSRQAILRLALCVRRDRREFQKDNIAVKTVEHYLTSRVNASIGIAKDTKDVDAVVESLGLLYGNGKYADIRLYDRKTQTQGRAVLHAMRMVGFPESVIWK